jgi:hypothetical protein
LLLATGSANGAVCVYAAVEIARERLTLRRYPRAQRRWSELIANLRRAVGDAAFERAWGQGRGWSIEDAIAHAAQCIAESATQARAATVD